MSLVEPEQPEAAFQLLPLASPSRAVSAGWRSRLVPAVIVVAVLASGIAWAVLSPSAPQSSGSRVEMEVRGLHCPIQCGLRAAGALESLPWVVKGSVETD